MLSAGAKGLQEPGEDCSSGTQWVAVQNQNPDFFFFFDCYVLFYYFFKLRYI